jgi:hypothetical protein
MRVKMDAAAGRTDVADCPAAGHVLHGHFAAVAHVHTRSLLAKVVRGWGILEPPQLVALLERADRVCATRIVVSL